MAIDRIMKALIPEVEKHLNDIDQNSDVNYCELNIKIHNGSIQTEAKKKSKTKY